MTGPGRREDPEAQRRMQQRRDEQTRASAGQPPSMPPLRDPDGGPLKIHIESASEDYFAGFTQRRGPDGRVLDPSRGFGGTPLGDQSAISQSIRQVTDELRRAVDMSTQYSDQIRAASADQERRNAESNAAQREHLTRVLDAIEASMLRAEEREARAASRGVHEPTEDDRRPNDPYDDERRPADPDFDEFDDHARRPVDLDDHPALRDRLRPPNAPAPPSDDEEAPERPRRPRRRPGGGSGSPKPPRPPQDPVKPAPDPGEDRSTPRMSDYEFAPGSPEGRQEWERKDRRGGDEARRRDNQERIDRQATRLRENPLPHYRSSHHQYRRDARERFAEQVHQTLGQGDERRPTLLPQYDDDGNVTHHVLRKKGQEDERIEHGDERLPGLLKQAAKEKVVSTLAGGFRAAGFAGAAKAIPYVGQALAVADMVNQGAQWVTDQQKQNSQYQQIYASDSKLGGEALGNRLREEGYVFGQRFSWNGLNEEDARTAFRGVSQLGYQGAQRTEGLDLIEKQYSKLGIDVNRSLRLLGMGAQFANTNMGGLDKALQSVGKMARETGQNANVLYDNFEKNYAMTLRLSMGANSAMAAASLTGIGAGASRDFANVDYSPLGSEATRRILAGRSGMTYDEMEARYAQGDTLPYTQAVDSMNTQVYEAALGSQNNLRGVLQQEIDKRGGTDAVKGKTGAYRDIALEAMKSGQVDTENLKRFLSANGVEDASNLTGQQVVERVIQYMTGDMNLTEQTEEQKQKFNEKPSENAGLIDNPWSESTFVTDETSILGKLGFGEAGQKQKSLDAYNDRQLGEGEAGAGGEGKDMSNPVMEELIKKFGGDESVGIKVKTGNGEKVVSLSDAITYYPDQLNDGSATIVGGPADTDGQSVGTVTGGTVSNASDPSTVDDKTDRGGLEEGDWRKEHPSTSDDGSEGGGGGKVTLDMSDELKKWFKVNVSGGVTDPSTEAGAAGSVPPMPSSGVPQ